MKITYLKLENFIGIFNGLGLFEIEIDFKNSTNTIVLLQGANGKGKTVILSMLQPFASSYDDRNELILENEDGYKEIHIQNKDDEYIIKHYYLNKRKNKSVKSYISKNGEELNENGTVKSFENIIEEELDLTPSFFTLSRIGSNVKNFIGLKPAERKNFLSKFLPDISQYLFEYKKVNEKTLVVNKRIKSITNEIAKLDEEESLKNRKSLLSKQSKEYEETKEKLLSSINKNKGILSTLHSDEIKTEYEKAVEKINKSSENIGILENNIDEYLHELDLTLDLNEEISDEPYSEEIKEYEEKVNDINLKYNVEKESLKNLKSNNEENKNKLESLETELETYSMDKDIQEFLDLEEEYTTNLEEINENMESYDERFKLYKNDEEISLFQQFIGYIQDEPIFSKDLAIINEFIDNNILKTSRDKIVSRKNTLDKKMIDINNKIDAITKNINFYTNKLPLVEVLKNRPEECKIDTCSFIAESLKYQDANEKLNELDELLKEQESEKEKLNKKIENINNMIECYDDFNNLYSKITSSSYYEDMKKVFPNCFSNKENIFDFIRMDKNLLLDDFNTLLEFSHLYMDSEKLTSELNTVKNNIEILRSKDELINKTKKEINALKKKIESNNKEIEEKTELLTEYSEIFEEENEVLENYTELSKNLTVYKKMKLVNSNYSLKKKELDSDMKKIEELLEDNQDKTEELDRVYLHINKLNEEIDEVKYNLKRLQEFKKELEDLNSKYENLNILKNALSPTKGIPLLFIDIYLKKTKEIANKLLNIAYNGSFYIDEFELSENDFFIKVVKEDGLLVKDVTLTSQGEMALLSIAISFAIIQQSKKRYNIILIDEEDKELDEDNRRSYVEMIEEQLKILNVEQCFIISHNKEFDRADLDLILLDGHNVEIDSEEFMDGKNIIFK